MSLKDRLRSRKEAKANLSNEVCEFDISVKKIIKAIEKVENPADLGNIVKEFSRFLNTLSAQDTTVTVKGRFDLGQRTLLNCILSNFEKSNNELVENNLLDDGENKGSKLVRRRKSVRAKLEAAAAREEEI